MSSDPVQSFPPLVAPGCRVLVLGSMPSVASLDRQEYYGHARNAFWPLMAGLFGFDATAPYEARCLALTSAGVAVWDVLHACVRPGSLDSSIRRETEEPNRIDRLLVDYPSLHTLCFNGGKAEESWRRHFGRTDALAGLDPLPQTLRLPSTSPAMASLTLDQKRARWRVVAEAAALDRPLARDARGFGAEPAEAGQ